MTPVAVPEREFPPRTGPERRQLDAWLDFYRATLLMKCAGLDGDQLATRGVASSTLTLLGILRHMTFVEQVWFERIFTGVDVVDYYKRPEDREADFTDLDGAPIEDVAALYESTCERSRELAAGHDLDEVARRPWRDDAVDLRWIYVHLIEEYARHCGHADLLRELIDGTTGY